MLRIRKNGLDIIMDGWNIKPNFFLSVEISTRDIYIIE